MSATARITAALLLAAILVALPTPVLAGGVNPQGWKLSTYEGATEQISGWLNQLAEPAPQLWPDFPNVDNPAADFLASNGLEYGLDERNHCPQETCDILVAPGEFHLLTADYDLGFWQCSATEDGTGCAVALFNVGEVTASFEDVVVNNGFSLTGRYWNGDELPQAINGLVSHVSANMLNLPTSLNPAGSSNAGGNCSVRTGCEGVLWRVIIISGNEILGVAEMTVTAGE